NAALKNATYDCPSHISLFLTGGGISHIKGVRELLTHKTGRPVEIIAPGIDKYNKPECSALLGLINMATVEAEAREQVGHDFDRTKKEGFFSKLKNKFGGKKND
ncbi:MAG: hypothetical protein LBQ40_02375, partial [Clostridiales bacterium]|nr:hypothetical protein [Clostridiales bacterium]